MKRIRALLGERCPRCFEGRVFRGLIAMHERCPACGLVFEREHGYFTVAMVPYIFRMSGVVWLHLDRLVDPGG